MAFRFPRRVWYSAFPADRGVGGAYGYAVRNFLLSHLGVAPNSDTDTCSPRRPRMSLQLNVFARLGLCLCRLSAVPGPGLVYLFSFLTHTYANHLSTCILSMKCVLGF